MNKKFIIATVFVCVIIFSMIFYLIKGREKIENVGIGACDKMGNPEMKLTCSAVFNEDPLICRNVGNFDKYCYDSVFTVMEYVPESLCEEFSEYYPRTRCYLELAKLKKDHSFCEKTSGRYQDCSWELAKILKNTSLCEEIEAECEKNQCLAEVTGDISFCEKVPDISEKIMCLTKLSKKASIKTCEENIPEHPSILYVPDCIKHLAMKKQDIVLCDLIENKEVKYTCLASLSDTIDICDTAGGLFWKDFCRLEYIKKNI